MPINASAHSKVREQIEEARFWDEEVGALFPVSSQQQRDDLIGLGRHGRSKAKLHMLVNGHILHNLRKALTAPTRQLYGRAPPLESMFAPPEWVRAADARKKKRAREERRRRKARQMAERGMPTTGYQGSGGEEEEDSDGGGSDDDGDDGGGGGGGGAGGGGKRRKKKKKRQQEQEQEEESKKALSRSAAAAAAKRASTPMLTPSEFEAALSRLGVGLSAAQANALAKSIAGGGKDPRLSAADFERAMLVLGVPLIFGVDEVAQQERRIARARAREAERGGAQRHEAATRLQAWARGAACRNLGEAAAERAHLAFVNAFEEDLLPNGNVLRRHHPERGSRFSTIEYWRVEGGGWPGEGEGEGGAAQGGAGDDVDLKSGGGPLLVGADVAYASGARYLGGWALKRALRHGDGAFWAAAGECCLRGVFDWDGEPSTASCWYGDGSVYAGGWARGNPQGVGTARYAPEHGCGGVGGAVGQPPPAGAGGDGGDGARSLFRLCEDDAALWVRRAGARRTGRRPREAAAAAAAADGEEAEGAGGESRWGRACEEQLRDGLMLGSRFPVGALLRSVTAAAAVLPVSAGAALAKQLPLPPLNKVPAQEQAADAAAATAATTSAAAAAAAGSAAQPNPPASAAELAEWLAAALLRGVGAGQKGRQALYRGHFSAGERSGEGVMYRADGSLSHAGAWRRDAPKRVAAGAAGGGQGAEARRRAAARARARRRGAPAPGLSALRRSVGGGAVVAAKAAAAANAAAFAFPSSPLAGTTEVSGMDMEASTALTVGGSTQHTVWSTLGASGVAGTLGGRGGDVAAAPLPEPLLALRSAEAGAVRAGNSVRRCLLGFAPRQPEGCAGGGGGGGGWEGAVRRGADQWCADEVAALLALVLVGDEEGEAAEEEEVEEEAAEEEAAVVEAAPAPVSPSISPSRERRQLRATASTLPLCERVARAALAEGIDGATMGRIVRKQDSAAVRRLVQQERVDDGAGADACAEDEDETMWLLARITAKWQQLRQLRKAQRVLPQHKFLPKLHEFLGCVS